MQAKKKVLARKLSLLSMNRFERKKNVSLAIEMLGALKERLPSSLFDKIELTVAGGYDIKNLENVEHMQELKDLCEELNVTECVSFRPSVSDSER